MARRRGAARRTPGRVRRRAAATGERHRASDAHPARTCRRRTSRARWRASAGRARGHPVAHVRQRALGAYRQGALHGGFSGARPSLFSCRPRVSRRARHDRLPRRLPPGRADAHRVDRAGREDAISRDGSPLEFRPMTRRVRWLAVVVVVAVVGAVAAVLTTRDQPTPVRSTALGRLVAREVTAPPNTRVKIEVVNATRTSGLARRVTRLLRDRGFDVVKYSTSGAAQDSTVVIDRTNHPEWARLVGEALGGARVEARPDTSRYVDVTVVLGNTWRAPAQPFSP